MITSFELGNVRIFQGNGWHFDLPLLTVVCGTNSSGKSTLLKSLLLLRQSQGLKGTQDGIHGRLRFSGSETDLGSFQSFVSQNDQSLDITLSLTIKEKTRKFLNASEKEPDVSKSKKSKAGSPNREQVDYQLRATFIFGMRKQIGPLDAPTLEDPTYEEDNLLSRRPAHLKKAVFEFLDQNGSELCWHIESTWNQAVGEKNVERFELIIPRTFIQEWTKPYGISLGELGNSPDKDLARYETQLRGLLPTSMRVKMSSDKPRKGKEATSRLVDWPLPPPIERLLGDLRHSLSRIHYLGPLRTPAKRYYIAHLDASPSMDSQGEFLPYILREMGETSVLGVLRSSRPEGDKESLVRALNSWLYYFRCGNKTEHPDQIGEIRLESTKGVLLEVQLQGQVGKKRHALADSGFGYSQVLPILVRGLLAEPGDTLIVEQPELHLNPALQVRLAEFFVEMIRLGKQLFLETHSEHLVNSFRVLAAEDLTGHISRNSNITFVDLKDGVPHVQKLEVQPNGTIPEWPSSFFGDALELSSRLLKAQSKHKNLK
nr:AAA family ATPase [Nitrosomonas nitrosa]